MARKRGKKAEQAANLGFEAKLWLAADKLRNNMNAAEYKHVVLGLMFLKYISDAFVEMHGKLVAGEGEYDGCDPEDPDEYLAENVFWVPQEARWGFLQGKAKQPEIGKLVDDAMVAIESHNRSLKGSLPKIFGRADLDTQRLGELIDLIGTIGLGDAENRSKDILGRVYEYFLSEFASAEGKKGGQFYTPRCVVRVLVEMLAPYKGRAYDPAMGSGGFFVSSEKFIEKHGGKIGDVSVYGQQSNPTTWRLAAMNMATRGIDFNFGNQPANSFTNHLHPDLRADCQSGPRRSMVALPGQLLTNTQIPACIWFLTKTKKKRGRGAAAFRDRTGEVLFIDARKLGYMVDRVLRAFTDEDTAQIVSTSHAWKRDRDAYEDIPGFCKSASLNEIAEHGYVLTPGRYVGAEEVEDDGVPFAEKMQGLTRVSHSLSRVRNTAVGDPLQHAMLNI